MGCIKDGSHTGGEFDTEEKNFHINVLEPMAARFRLQALCGQASNTHVLLKIEKKIDAVPCVSKMMWHTSFGIGQYKETSG